MDQTHRLSLERPEVRAGAAVSLILLTLVSPYLPLPGTLPAVRLEQLLLLVLIGPLVLFHLRHPEHRSVGIVDLAFAGLGLATTATLLLAPLIVPTSTRSIRDVFEVAWILQLWIVYRLARTISMPPHLGPRLSRVLAVAAIALGTFALVQFLDPPGFNDLITGIWTQSHNLVGVEREGRAVGTAGNANQFGMLAAMLLVFALAGVVGDLPGARTLLLRLAIVASMAGVILSQSRGALIAGGVALLTGLILARIRGQARVAVVRGLPLVLLGATVAFGVMLAAPPDSGSVLRRFDPVAILRDPSVIIRLGRIGTVVVADPGANPVVPGAPDCVSSLMATSPAPGHEPGNAAPPPPPDKPASDVSALATAVAQYFCRTGSWPAGDLAASLVPTDIAAIPIDPTTGQPYVLYTSSRGFTVGSPVSSVATAPQDDDAAGLGSLPNLLQNPSFEAGADVPSSWLFTPGVGLHRDGGRTAAFGTSVGSASINEGGAVYQLVVADLPMTTPYVTGVWIRAATATTVQLYVVAIKADGERVDPLAASTVDIAGDGNWHHALLSFRTLPDHLTSLQVMVRAPRTESHIDLDGATLTEGPVARAFGPLVDGNAAAATGDAVLRQSPILGLGPQKESGEAAYDNEYLSFLARYGLLGLTAYLFLFGAALVEGVRAARRDQGWIGFLGVGLAATTMALFAFAISAGAYRQLQIMVIFWVVAGLVAAASSRRTRAHEVTGEPSSAT